MTSTGEASSVDPLIFPRKQDDYKDRFLSDKLDLVFVLDTHPGMENFYKKNLFGPNFLSRFQKYDWRFAYTDMSVDVNNFLKQEKEKKEEEDEKSCGFWSGLVMTAGGVAAGRPFITAFGLRNLFGCASQSFDSIFSDDEKTAAKSFANGAFLSLEYKGKKLSYNGLNYMPKSVANYNEIFNHTVTLGNKKDDDDYEAPEIKDLEAYPFLSTALSLANGNRPLNTNSQNNTNSFFRDDSAIVYVLVTVHDMQIDITAKQLKESLKSFFISEKRVRIIPVTLSSNPSFICQLYSKQKSSSDSYKLRELASELDSSAINICSQDLPDELFEEISKSLYPTGFLSD